MLSSIAIDSPVGGLTITDYRGRHRCDRLGPQRWQARRRRCSPRHAASSTPISHGRLNHFDLPLLADGSPFEQRVWAAMRQIPLGRTRSYGELAMEIGSGRAPSAALAAATRSRSSYRATGCWRAAASAATAAAPGSRQSAFFWSWRVPVRPVYSPSPARTGGSLLFRLRSRSER